MDLQQIQRQGRMAIPRSRRLVIDALHYHRQVPTSAHDRMIDLRP